MLKAGIHENVKLSAGLSKNGFKQVLLKQEKAADLLAAFDAGMSNTNELHNIMIFDVPTVNKYGDLKGQPRTFQEVFKEVTETRNLFVELLTPFMTKDEASSKFSAFDMCQGIGDPTMLFSPEQQVVTFTNQEIVNRMVTNLFNIFTEECKPFADSKVRIKLRRQSKKSAQGTFPYSNQGVMIESMDIPKEQSKIAWSEYEISKECNSTVEAPTTQASSADVAKANDAFGLNTPPTAPTTGTDLF